MKRNVLLKNRTYRPRQELKYTNQNATASTHLLYIKLGFSLFILISNLVKKHSFNQCQLYSSITLSLRKQNEGRQYENTKNSDSIQERYFEEDLENFASQSYQKQRSLKYEYRHQQSQDMMME